METKILSASFGRYWSKNDLISLRNVLKLGLDAGEAEGYKEEPFIEGLLKYIDVTISDSEG